MSNIEFEFLFKLNWFIIATTSNKPFTNKKPEGSKTILIYPVIYMALLIVLYGFIIDLHAGYARLAWLHITLFTITVISEEQY